ncbi:3-dehydroquinate synthase family protein [Exiguobacterium sp.]|uniref:3-dehydroquinate synthase n=1 Tax=Exiguobacterium sp. TaxID=44751 RepID=UPI00289E3C46|nr:3-dehydroquinate synthase family protein [Exiguobacterium sp.]
MIELDIRLKTSYPVFVGNGALARLSHLSALNEADRIWIITDETVRDLHLHTLQEALGSISQSTNIHVSTVPAGEQSKSLAVYGSLLEEGIRHGMTRHSIILAFGGGMIGDLATLLAHDSSVGGKVGVNLSLGKNLVGAFYQPSGVVYDLTLLQTLPDREWRSGFFELVKHGFLARPSFADTLLDVSLDTIKGLDLEDWLARGINVKRDIVEQDETEQGMRAFLNYGHTFGHAVEYASPGLSHGEAVGIGLVFVKFLEGNEEQAEQLGRLLHRLGTGLPDRQSFETYLELMRRDKKNHQTTIRFVLEKEGRFDLEAISEERLQQAFNQTMRCLEWD